MPDNIIDSCCICGNTELIPVVDLGVQYLTGIFPKNNKTENLTMGALSLVKCLQVRTKSKFGYQ